MGAMAELFSQNTGDFHTLIFLFYKFSYNEDVVL